ncbi:hypothetical protein CRG98_012000 [Punica granatum]|uniref:Reverse transcriptase/retrotransposon-derived protein RNase H-like domain-containing protein n=1 Tax=Punica granatum TaxID=22663 RepID=A0A2I0KH23_PUNGR|nr:hypothetical protein CRG98_012000 [Punica granatum]
MNPETPRLFMAQEDEIKQIFNDLQYLIEPSDAPWACEAFYVNKRFEQARGKLRLAINYQPLNHFLRDNKFPLPNKQAIFSSLSKAKVFSKFDLKAGFWQLGIHPEDKPKIGFCIPKAHYQRKKEAHILLLRRFSEIVQDCGIMLSEKKMVIAQREINFLGIQLTNGQYQSEPHVAQELLKYPEESLTKKQIQQFLGTVNYLRDFLPKITKLTRPLEKMLKKDNPAWDLNQTKAIQELKAQLQSLHPLQIPSTGKRVLQTDASDRYWGAVLLEELDGKRHICGYRSGRNNCLTLNYSGGQNGSLSLTLKSNTSRGNTIRWRTSCQGRNKH